MATFSRILLSGSTNGKGILVSATNVAVGVTIHTAVTGTSSIDEIELRAVNNNASGVTRTLTIGWGGTTNPDNTFAVPIPAGGGPTIITDLPFVLQNALVVKAAADVVNEVVVYGAANRIA